MSRRHRGCVLLEGSPEETRAAAAARVAGLDEVLWIDRPHEAATELGQSYAAVVVNLHAGFDADLLGRAHGLVVGGGCLLLRLPPGAPRSRLEARARAALAGLDPGPLPSPPAVPPGSAEQAALVDRLRGALARPAAPGAAFAILADRGRGKSSALGLVARGLDARDEVVITAATPRAAEVARAFCPALGFVPAFELAYGGARSPRVILVDEAAQLPVPLLQQLARQHPRAHLVFATTTHGYEGTGRGFSLRFLDWLEEERALTRLALEAPVRWGADDPLEAAVHRALLLDAEPAAAALVDGASPDTVVHARLDKAALTADEARLREVFGLLVQAHYRTTPADLARLLDDEAIEVHALLHDGRAVAATLVAREGALDDETVGRLLRGERLRGHALAETLVCHSLRPEAGGLEMIRSMRIVTHPALRRRGLARRLVDEVHRAYAPDLFGTLFGATPELLAFRRALGYRLVRVGASFGARTGEPTAVMLRPVSDRARALTDALQAELARDLPGLLELLAVEGALRPSPALDEALRAGLPAPAPLDDEADRARVRAFAFGPLPYEAAAQALERWLPADLSALDDEQAALVRARVVEGRSWTRIARERYAADTSRVPALMRALRRSIRALWGPGS